MADPSAVKALEEKIFRLENELQEFRELFSMALDLVCVADIHSSAFLKVNPAFHDVLGYAEGELTNQLFFDFVHPDDMASTREIIQTRLHQGAKTLKFENRYRCKNGNYRWLHWAFRPNPEQGKIYAIARDTTDHKLMAKKRDDSEKKYRSLFYNAQVALFRTSIDGRILEINKRYAEIAGYDTVDACMAEFNLKKAWKDPGARDKFLKRIQETGSVSDYEAQIIRRDGTTVWILFSATIFPDEGHIEGSIVNITDRKQAEDAIRQSEAFKRKMVANIGDVIVIIDRDGINRYKSPNIEKLFGWKPEEIVGKSTWENVHPDDLFSTQNFIKNLMDETDTVKRTECRYKCRDGRYKWIEFTGTNLIHDPDIRGILGNYHDITHRKAIEDSLRESEARFKALHNASFGGITIHDKGVILECNQGLSDISGYSLDELVGMDGLGLIAEQSRTMVMEKIQSGYEKPYEAVGRRKNGDEFPIRLEARNIPYKGKDVRVVEFRDITEHKRAEQEKEKLQGQLIQSQKMEAIGTLAGGIAHDFNNMLSGIFGFSQLAKNHLKAPERAGKDIDNIVKMAQKATDLVRQILTFSQKSSEQKVPLPIHIIVKEALQLLRASIPSFIEIKESIQSKATVMANPTNIHQIIMNLGTNAYHAMNEKGGTLAVSLKEVVLSPKDTPKVREMVPGRYLKLEVSDDGSGMDRATVTKVFEPYFTTKAPGKGTGLGLALVIGIVEDHNGHIKVYSEPNQGTTFHVYLPVLDQAADLPPLELKEDTSAISGSETILMADDDEALLNTSKTLLEGMGYTVKAFLNAPAALEAYKKTPEKFDIVITDMTMPAMTGAEFAGRLLEINPGQNIILCTGHSELINKESALSMGISAYFEKPIIIKELAGQIRRVLDKK